MSGPVGEYILQGDAEAAVLDILRNDTPELISSTPVSIKSNLIGYTPGDRWIVVEQQGASETWPKISRPRIDVEVFAERRTVAKELAEICLASLKRAMGTYFGFGLFISDCKLELGITRIPDKLQETSRYVFAVRLTIVPSGPALQVPLS